jgi:tRNA G18 (ribose-2'-O)-methylase SpoU
VPTIAPVDDPADPRIEAYLDVRERDLVGRRRGFLAEGEVVLRALLRGSRHGLESVLLAERRVEKLRPLLRELPESVPVYTATQAVMDTVTGFHIHRGVLALGRRAPDLGGEALLAGLPRRALVVAVFGVGNHDNMGGIFRNAAAFGADAVLLDEGCCDPLYRKAIRVSVGAALSVPFARGPSGGQAVALLARHGFEALALSPGSREVLASVRRAERAAVLLGAEGPGLPREVLDRARGVGIPMAGAFDSLNVATACGIALHHLVFAAEEGNG